MNLVYSKIVIRNLHTMKRKEMQKVEGDKRGTETLRVMFIPFLVVRFTFDLLT